MDFENISELPYWSMLVYYMVINGYAFLLFFADKHKARRHEWRIPEQKLLMTAFLGGGFGASAGMKIFRHKTQKNTFKILIPTSMILHGYIIYTYFANKFFE